MVFKQLKDRVIYGHLQRKSKRPTFIAALGMPYKKETLEHRPKSGKVMLPKSQNLLIANLGHYWIGGEGEYQRFMSQNLI